MKIAPLFRVYKKRKEITPILVHTNQHSDDKMSGTFFKSLGIPEQDYTLDTDKTSPSSTISSIMQGLGGILKKEKPDIVLVVGDVNSTLAAALAAHKEGVKVAHVEAGLRSRDRGMPEEINRILVDQISDMLFVTEESGIENLKNERVDDQRIHFVGNVMIDNLIHMLKAIDKSNIHKKIGLEKEKYAIMTMHRPANVDYKEKLLALLEIKKRVTRENGIKIVFPIHPRTQNNLDSHGLMTELGNIKNVIITEPLDYLDFTKLAKESALIITDSGGIQEEAAYLKVPTITLRDSTERPSTIICGANTLHSIEDTEGLLTKVKLAINIDRSIIKDVELNDGQASERIVANIINEFLNK